MVKEYWRVIGILTSFEQLGDCLGVLHNQSQSQQLEAYSLCFFQPRDPYTRNTETLTRSDSYVTLLAAWAGREQCSPEALNPQPMHPTEVQPGVPVPALKRRHRNHFWACKAGSHMNSLGCEALCSGQGQACTPVPLRLEVELKTDEALALMRGSGLPWFIPCLTCGVCSLGLLLIRESPAMCGSRRHPTVETPTFQERIRRVLHARVRGASCFGVLGH